MDSSGLRYRAVALIAAYAVAMQALLSSFMPAAPAIPDIAFAALCLRDGSDGSGHPARHDLPCAAICAALGHGLAGPLPPDIVVAFSAPQAIVALTPVDGWVTPRLAIRGPQAARAPPLA
ncbi:MAG: hypothetical protein WEA28_04155 [Xanthobacteraceae bacterium]